MTRRIRNCLWFDGQAEDAAQFYVSSFKNSRIETVRHYSDVGPGKKGTVMLVTFEIDGQDFMALNGGPQFQFSPATSFIIRCDTQAEIDRLWERLSSDGGETLQCGWLRDKYGVSWQIVPAALEDLMSKADAAQTERVMKAVLQMTRLEIAELHRAFSAAA
jgi:predicted 3-demethylubiquinone-9 3-methyltransferase (glyoxalase superfamily)